MSRSDTPPQPLVEQRRALALAGVLMLAGVGLRLLPHPANFAPVTAIAIFGGAVLPRRLSIWVPVGLMMVSDVLIGLHSLIVVTWGCYALTALFSSLYLKRPRLASTATLTLSSSLGFFVVTNFAVWLTSGMYTHSWSGLVHCYFLALPFFRNSLLSDLLYTAALFSVYWLALGQRGRSAALFVTRRPVR